MHHDMRLIEITLVVVAALAGGLGFVRLKQPPILGYILAGIILGPSGFAYVESRDIVETMAELGVLLLLFVVGMELNLRTFKNAWLQTTLCTVLQIFISLVVSLGLAPFFGWSLGMSLLLGFVLALSSTAVVVNLLERIGEVRSESGQLAIGILIAQDLAIVPMILILRNLNNGSIFDPGLIIKLALSVAIIVALISYLSQKQRVRIPLTQIISGEKDLTPLASLGFCFAAAAVSGLIGLSAAYGAFLAGLVLGNTHERIVLLETTKPIQSTLLMVFFLSIGLLLDLSFIAEHWIMVTVLLFVITVGKTAINIGILHILRLPRAQSFLVGVILSQLGEFAFLLATVGYQSGIIDDHGQKLIVALTVLSLAFSPLWLASARRLKAHVDSRALSFTKILAMAFGPEFSWVQRRIQRKKSMLKEVIVDDEDG
ncbi:cation:proton antiporter [Candidatus Odyssella thessalonicensis]|uniref:cation:proton antiporter n=1 Tax=Candidatus Odyssella thessalonicensis TaxID=84647 RepID=UPI000225AC0B|nr:cation:proton antiporter [Candidatus Odyssella thessalonicensis]